MTTLDDIREKLIEAIKYSGKSQKEIAEAIGVKPPQISCYLHGKKMPALDTLSRLCEFLDVDANYILCVGVL